MKLKFILLSCLIGFSIMVKAQNFSVQGKLQDEESKTPVRGATLQLKSRKDSTYSFNTFSDSAGRYSFNNLRADTFNLIITSIGYERLSRTVRVDSANVNMGVVSLPKTSQQLSGVTVTANVPPAVQKGDTVQFNASQYKVNPDATAEDLTRKLPGVTIENGQVTAQGESVKRVTVDGREFFGDDATAALRNLPAEIIDKIQVYDRLSDQAQFTGFDDGNSAKEINIITKANMRNGQFGRVFAGYGTDNRYQAGGNTTILNGNRRISLVGLANNVNQQNFSSQDLLGVSSASRRGGGGPRGGGGGGGPRGGGGGSRGGGSYGGFGGNSNFLVGQQNGINRTNSIGINYSDIWGPKVTVSSSYFFNNNNNTTNEILNRKYLLEGVPDYNQNTDANSHNSNHRFNMRLEYKIDSSNQIIITPNLSFQNNNTAQNVSTSSFFSPSEMVNETQNNTNSTRAGNNLNNSILYRHAFAKRGRTFSINLNTSYNKSTGETYIETHNRQYSGAAFTDSASQRLTDQANNGYQLSANIVYTEPLGKKSMLEFNYNPSYSKSNADQEAYVYDAGNNKYSLFDTTLSNKFNSVYKAQNAGIGYRLGDRDKQLAIGVNYQQSQLSSDRTFPVAVGVNKTFYNILPNAMLRYKISARSSLRVFYRASTNQPSVTQLQDVYDITNPPFITAGNPNLLQQYNQILSTRYTYTNAAKGIILMANVFGQTANNYITNATFLPQRDSVINSKIVLPRGQQLSMPVNLDGYTSLRSFLTFAFPVKFIKSNINFNGGFTYNRLPGIINSVHNIADNYIYTAGAVIGSNISEYVDFTVSYSGNFNSVKNQSALATDDHYFTQTAGVRLNLLSKKGWFFTNDLNNQLSSGLSEGFNQDYWLWNISAGKKILKDQKGELRLSVFDLLKQNQSIERTVNGSYIEDSQNQVLRQYFMLTFTYNLRNFGTAAKNMMNRSNEGRNWGGGRF